MRLNKKTIAYLCMALFAVTLLGIFLIKKNQSNKNDIRHVFLLVFDTLRADRMSVYGHDQKTTPFLNSSRSSYVVFKNPRSTAPWTIPSHASIFTGKLPSEHGAQWGNAMLDESHETLAETLLNQGFTTHALVANKFIQTKKVGLLQGFQNVYSPKKKKEEMILRQLDIELSKPEVKDQRLFMFFNFMNNHLPLNPGRYAKEFNAEGKPFIEGEKSLWKISAGLMDFPEDKKARFRRLYDASVRYSDELAERIIKTLDKHGLLDKSLVIVTSDHGEGLGYHKELGHTISSWEEQLFVPLLIRFPHGASGGLEITDRASLVGLRSFVLNLAGQQSVGIDQAINSLLEDSSETIADYRSYFNEAARSFNKRIKKRYPTLVDKVHHSHVLYCGKFKLKVHANEISEFHDIVTDPHEQTNVKAQEQSEYDKCYKKYQGLLARNYFTPFNSDNSSSAPSEIDESEVESLKSLGYL